MKKFWFLIAIFSVMLISCTGNVNDSASISVRLPQVSDSRNMNYSQSQIETFKVEILPEGFTAESLFETAAPGTDLQFVIKTGGVYTVKVSGLNSTFGTIASGSASVQVALGKTSDVTVSVKMAQRPTGETEITVIAYNITLVSEKSSDGTTVTYTVAKLNDDGSTSVLSENLFSSIEWFLNGNLVSAGINQAALSYTVNFTTDTNLADFGEMNSIYAVVTYGTELYKSCSAEFETKIETDSETSVTSGSN